MNKGQENNGQSGFGARLRQLRTDQKLSRADLARMVGMNENHLGRYERGDSQPTADKIKKLAAALGVSGDYLLDSMTENAARAMLDDREMLDLFHEAEQLSAEDRLVVKKLLSAFINQKKIHALTAR